MIDPIRRNMLATAVAATVLVSARQVFAQAASNAIPPDYRQKIARYLLGLGLEPKSLRSAMIAKPYNKPDGIWGRLTGTTVPVVCVSHDTRNMLGQEFKGYFVFWFENGALQRWNTGSGVLVSECGAFSSFTEVNSR